ncbi:hypothetical protein [Nibricoccus aquaticus]|nr:hypothetical protein [Nibricoccus aquaticus]
MFIAMAVGVLGWFRMLAMSGDFQPIAFFFVCLSASAILTLAAIGGTFYGARRRPRSVPTIAAMYLAGASGITMVAIAIWILLSFSS